MKATGEMLVLAGSLLTLLAAVGVLRFNDVFVRMHALGKATTTGLLLALAGGATALEHPNDITSLCLAAFLHLATSPIGNVLVSRATYLAEGIAHGIDTVDELATADPDRTSIAHRETRPAENQPGQPATGGSAES